MPGGAALSAQAGAPAPIGVFSDLRWLFVYEKSVPGFVLEAFIVLVVRSVLTFAMVHDAWPTTVSRPRATDLLVRSTAFTFALALLLSPFVLLLFAFAAFPVSWLFFSSFPVVVVLSLFLHGASASASWWRRPPSPRALGYLALSYVVLSGFGALQSELSGPATLLVAALAGLVDALSWCKVIGAVVDRRPSKRLVPVVPVAVVVFLVASVSGAGIGFAVAKRAPGGAGEKSAGLAPPRRGERPLLVASGFASHSSGAPELAFLSRSSVALEAFSYRGMSPSGAPLSYDAADTERPIGVLADLMAAQVRALSRQTAAKVTVVAESEGSLIAATMLARHRHLPVHAVVLVSPIVASSVSYPRPGDSGWGDVAGEGLSVLADALAPLAPIDLSPDDPFLRSLLAMRRSPYELARSSRVRTVIVAPLADAVGAPSRGRLVRDEIVVASFHGANLKDPSVERLVEEAMSGSVEKLTSWSGVAHLVAALSESWRVPGLRAPDRASSLAANA